MDQIRRPPDERTSALAQDVPAAIIESSLKVGAACGTAGFLFGGTAGIVRGSPPFLFATASALQTFALGTTYWGCRTAILHAWTPAHQTPSDLIKASAISGGITGGTIAVLTRGRSNIIPGIIMFSLFGSLGQVAYNTLATPSDASAETKPGFWKRMSETRFSPVKVLSNGEYAELLREKMLKAEVEIAIIDDKIAALRQEQQDATKATQQAEP